MIQLLSHITRVKKKNELRAEIKRTHHEKEVVDEDEDDQPEKDSNEKEQNPEQK
jgi:hypothetical protein